MWLDFCCMYSGTVINCLQTISSKKLLADDGILGITLMYGREPNINNLIPFLEENEKRDTDSLRYRAFPRYVSEIIFQGKVKLHTVLKYHDKGERNSATPMLIYIFQKSNIDYNKKGIIELKFKPL